MVGLGFEFRLDGLSTNEARLGIRLFFVVVQSLPGPRPTFPDAEDF